MSGYAHLKVPALDQLLESRGLPVEGNKTAKVKALEDSDATASTPAEPVAAVTSETPDVQPDEAPASEGRLVRQPVTLLIEGRATFFDKGKTMPADIISAYHVGDHIFQENQ